MPEGKSTAESAINYSEAVKYGAIGAALIGGAYLINSVGSNVGSAYSRASGDITSLAGSADKALGGVLTAFSPTPAVLSKTSVYPELPDGVKQAIESDSKLSGMTSLQVFSSGFSLLNYGTLSYVLSSPWGSWVGFRTPVFASMLCSFGLGKTFMSDMINSFRLNDMTTAALGALGDVSAFIFAVTFVGVFGGDYKRASMGIITLGVVLGLMRVMSQDKVFSDIISPLEESGNERRENDPSDELMQILRSFVKLSLVSVRNLTMLLKSMSAEEIDLVRRTKGEGSPELEIIYKSAEIEKKIESIWSQYPEGIGEINDKANEMWNSPHPPPKGSELNDAIAYYLVLPSNRGTEFFGGNSGVSQLPIFIMQSLSTRSYFSSDGRFVTPIPSGATETWGDEAASEGGSIAYNLQNGNFEYVNPADGITHGATIGSSDPKKILGNFWYAMYPKTIPFSIEGAALHPPALPAPPPTPLPEASKPTRYLH